ncbi:MAG: hypothetical protein AAGK37_20255 [Pseudomonadota bacterium]
MIQYAALGLSLLLNAIFAIGLYLPDRNSGPKMTCVEATNDGLNKRATQAFIDASEGSFDATHRFLRASDYELRDISREIGMPTFVYVARHYRNTCGLHLPGIDGSIVRVGVDPSRDFQVTGAW